MEPIYLDNAATTAVSSKALSVMLPAYANYYGNASAVHAFGREARKKMEEARAAIASLLGAKAEEIYFTSGGTESDNWAIRGIAAGSKQKGKHIITTQIEHHAVLNTCAALEKEGWEITRLKPDGKGRIDPKEVEAAIRPDTVLISVMTANNEIGTVEPVAAIGTVAKKHGVPFHTDAVQACGSIPVNVNDMQVDLLSMSAHKFHGPKGIGVLYIRKGTAVKPLLFGGAQEKGLRPSTENVPAILGMAAAYEQACGELEENYYKISILRDCFVNRVLYEIPDTILNGDSFSRLPGNAHFSFKNVSGEALLLRLDMMNIAASAGASCTAGSIEPSHVLKAIGLEDEWAKGSIRFSIGKDNTEEEMEQVAGILPGLIRDLRGQSDF